MVADAIVDTHENDSYKCNYKLDSEFDGAVNSGRILNRISFALENHFVVGF